MKSNQSGGGGGIEDQSEVWYTEECDPGEGHARASKTKGIAMLPCMLIYCTCTYVELRTGIHA
jgi:hypothetical protein